MKLPAAAAITVALINGPSACVVAGQPRALEAFQTAIMAEAADPANGSQARTPYSQRKPEITTAFLRTTAPFHSGAMAAAAVTASSADAARLGLVVPGTALTIPVYSTADGTDLAASGAEDVMPAIISMQAAECMDFRVAMRAAMVSSVTHVLDFGPGGTDGIGGSALFAARLTEGTGTQVIVARAKAAHVGRSDTPTLSGSDRLFVPAGEVKYALDWAKQFGPKL
eukprot:SAG31_NODE_5400_length_2559_cov_2.225610_3_plen_226_part_00